jgi:hypothetical protein
MAKLEKVAGATSEIWQIFIADSSSTTGAGLTGLVFNTASLTAYYHRDTDTTATAITLATMTVGTFTSSGFKEIDATNMPGWYQFCPPNAAIASGAKSCAFHLKGATNMAPLPIEVQLTAVNPDSATAFMTSVATVTTVTNQLTAAQIATGVWQDATAGDFTTASSIGKSLYTSGVVPGGTNGLFIAGTNAATTITTALTTTFTGSLTGSVASVTAGVTLAASAVQAIWDALTSALTTVGSIGKLLVTNVDALISSRMATYTQPTGFLAATFPATVASTTNITAGTITTVTNLTNAPTAGDLTATMKTSVTTAATAATPIAASVSGNVSGSIGSLATQAKADVNAEVLDVLTVDTFAEPSSVPAATSSIKDKLNYLFVWRRNKVTQTATTTLLRNDADAATIATTTVADDGTTFTKSEDV